MLKRAIPLAIFFIALDQSLKLLAQRSFAPRGSRVVIPNFFDLCYVLNEGASWGIFHGWRWPLVIFAVVAATLLIVFRRHVFPPQHPLPGLTLALLLGGIIGNLIDRIRLAAVIDFIHVHWYQHSFPVFNIADACISVGLMLYIGGQIYAERQSKRTAEE